MNAWFFSFSLERTSSFVRSHENFRLLRFVSTYLDSLRNDGTVWSLCHWQLDSPLYSRRVTDFSFPRKFPYSRLWQEIFTPSTFPSFSIFGFLRSFSRPQSQFRGASYPSTDHGRRFVTGHPPFFGFEHSSKSAFLWITVDGRTLRRMDLPIDVYKSSATREPFKGVWRPLQFLDLTPFFFSFS